jgi:queuine tRNA-ribosyltransferase
MVGDFNIVSEAAGSSARAGVLTTAHGQIQTPIFMPVGTLATVKTVHQRALKEEVKAQIILGNTYHLYLRPGMEIMREAGGIHSFMNWDFPILTDSGGFQVYSLSHRRNIREEGVTFQSHIDGSRHFFSPEGVMDIQRTIGADIMMAFDECTPYPCEYGYAERSMHLTHRWLKRCMDHFHKSEGLYGYQQLLAPIVQGSVYPKLREQSATFIASMNAQINAIGGLSVGEPAEDMYAMTELVCGILPKDRPRYLMGVGTPENLIECIDRGIDMFDCVMPTRNARHGVLFTYEGKINIKNKKWEKDFSPIDEQSPAEVSRLHSKAYLRHLFVASEYLGPQIATLHNLSFYLRLVQDARQHIQKGSFVEWKKEILPKLSRKV